MTRIIYTQCGSWSYRFFYGVDMACNCIYFTIIYINQPLVGHNLGFWDAKCIFNSSLFTFRSDHMITIWLGLVNIEIIDILKKSHTGET